MAASKLAEKHKRVVKKTTQGGRIKHAGLNKHEKRSFKQYRGQGR